MGDEIMLIISCDEMKAMDSYAIDNIGIPSIVLMENAALKVIKNIDLNKVNSATIICSVGNNGGDGLAVARHLILNGKNVDLFIIGNLNRGTKDFNINLNILKNMDVDFVHISKNQDLNIVEKAINKNDLTIDSIFGIGLTRNISGIFYDVVEIINKHSKSILAIDIPSGLNGDTGEIMGIAIKANKTITFHHIKNGLVNNEEYTGKIVVENIGIPNKVTLGVLGTQCHQLKEKQKEKS